MAGARYAPRLDLPSSGARSFVEIERSRRAREGSDAGTRRRTGARKGDARNRRRRSGTRSAWEVVGWIAVSVLLALAGIGAVALVPGFFPSVEAPTPARRVPKRAARDGEGGSGTALLPSGGVPLTRQVTAPEVVDLVAGDLADAWTLESISGASTLRVEVPTVRLGEAFMRASLVLRTAAGRRAWTRLGADRLELRSEDAAITLEIMSRLGS